MYTVKTGGNDEITIETGENVFSPSRADKGTAYMLREAEKLFAGPGGGPKKILDLGCGAGIAGIYIAKTCGVAEVHFTDIDGECVMLSLENAAANGISGKCTVKAYVSDAFSDITDADFDLIMSNPPYHTDFAVAKAFIEGSFRHMSIGGKLLMVTKRLDWYKNKLINIFGGVKITRTDDGYFVFAAEKRNDRPAKTKPLKKR